MKIGSQGHAFITWSLNKFGRLDFPGANKPNLGYMVLSCAYISFAVVVTERLCEVERCSFSSISACSGGRFSRNMRAGQLSLQKNTEE